MNTVTKTTSLAITQAKVTRKDGTVEYHFSVPEFGKWDIKGRLWVWRRKRAFKKER